MLFVLTIALLFLLLAPILLGRDKRLFVGLNLYCFLNAILIVPGILALLIEPELLNPDVYLSVSPTGAAMAWTIAMIGMMSLMVFVGYYCVTRQRRPVPADAPAVPQVRLHPYESNLAIALLMALSFAVFLQKLALFGGFAGILGAVQNRVALQAGLGPINFLASAATVLATILATRRAIVNRNTRSWAILAIVGGSAMLMSSLFGGRKDSMQLAIMILAVLSLYNARFLRLNGRTLILLGAAYGAALLYFMTVLIYRSGLGNDWSLGNFAAQLALAFDGYGQFLLSLSYFDTYLFVTNFFDAANYYHGATFRDLLTSFAPSGLLPDKPPVDDGMFVRAATLGYMLQPGTPAYLIDHNSFPPETLGAAYMNGGAFLVGLFGLLLGFVLGYAQRLIVRLPNSPWVIALYLNAFLNFEISNLRIVQMIALAAFGFLLIVALRGLALLTAGRNQPAAAWAR